MTKIYDLAKAKTSISNKIGMYVGTNVRTSH
jgi:hypothetical protein